VDADKTHPAGYQDHDWPPSRLRALASECRGQL
jgi:hypothetical protein